MGELMRITRPMGDEARIPRGGPFSSRCCFLSRYRVAVEPESLPRWPREDRELREPELSSPRLRGSKPATNPRAMAWRGRCGALLAQNGGGGPPATGPPLPAPHGPSVSPGPFQTACTQTWAGRAGIDSGCERCVHRVAPAPAAPAFSGPRHAFPTLDQLWVHSLARTSGAST